MADFPTEQHWSLAAKIGGAVAAFWAVVKWLLEPRMVTAIRTVLQVELTKLNEAVTTLEKLSIRHEAFEQRIERIERDLDHLRHGPAPS